MTSPTGRVYTAFSDVAPLVDGVVVGHGALLAIGQMWPSPSSHCLAVSFRPVEGCSKSIVERTIKQGNVLILCIFMETILKPYEQPFLWSLDWNLLRTFMAVVDQGGVTRAADYLNVSQPTISSALKRLEDTTGKHLLDRRPGHFALTAAGESLYHESSSVVRTIAHIPSFMSAAEDQISGHVSIALTSHVTSPHFDAVLSRFNATYPDVSYSLSVTESLDVVSRVRQNKATAGICLMNRDIEGVTSEPLYREYFGLYCGSAHELFERRDITPETLTGQQSVSFQTEIEDGPLFKVRKLRDLVRLHPEPKAVSANLGEVRRLISAGVGVGALPIHVAQRDVDLGLLWQLPPYTHLPEVDVHIVLSSVRSLDPAEHAFLEMLTDMLRGTPFSERMYGSALFEEGISI